MSEQTTQTSQASAVKSDPAAGADQARSQQRKPFIEPTISVPKDVLEATTFFLQATPGTGAADIP